MNTIINPDYQIDFKGYYLEVNVDIDTCIDVCRKRFDRLFSVELQPLITIATRTGGLVTDIQLSNVDDNHIRIHFRVDNNGTIKVHTFQVDDDIFWGQPIFNISRYTKLSLEAWENIYA